MRRANWPRHLTTWAESKLGAPFLWGVTDCGQLAIGALVALGLRPQVPPYGSPETAGGVVVTLGGLGAYLEALGCLPVSYASRQPGDLVLVPVAGRAYPAIFVCVHDRLLGVPEGGRVAWIPSLTREAAAAALVYRPPV